MEIIRGEKSKLVVEKISWKEKDWIAISVLNNYKGNWIERKRILFNLGELQQIAEYEKGLYERGLNVAQV
jgi:uncharacterized Fe-S cluster-containing radical SAM superfamily enzyme